MNACPESGRRSSLLGGLVAGLVLVAGIAVAGGEVERATAALGEAGRLAVKGAAKGAIWIAGHRSAAAEDEEATGEIVVVLQPGSHACPRPRRSCARVVVQRTLQ